MCRWFAATVGLVIAGCLPLEGQQAGKVAEIHVNVVKQGGTDQYEAARKKHWGWHRSQGDTWSWYVWSVVTGENTGSYIVGSFGHDWKDEDGENAKVGGEEPADLSVEPYLDKEQEVFYQYRADLSLAPEHFPPPPLLFVIHLTLYPEAENDFVDAVKRMNEGIRKATQSANASRWYELVNGGECPHFVWTSDLENWGSFQAPMSLESMVEHAYGKEQSKTVLLSVRKAVRSMYTETLQYRPDLSYIPTSKR